MSRSMIAVRGFGFLLPVPLGLFMLWEVGCALAAGARANDGGDVALVCCSCAALMLLNAALLSTSAAMGAPRLVIAHVILAPPTAWLCYVGSVDPVALFLALPLLAGLAVAAGASSCPLRRPAAAR